jgi:hypothetical protein
MGPAARGRPGGWSSSEGRSPEGVDDGDARTESGAEVGLRLRKAGEADAWAVEKACAALGRGRARRTTRGGEENRSTTGGSFLRGGGGQQRGGGPAAEMPCSAGAAWGLAPSGGQHPDRVPPAARAGGAPLFRQWCTDAADARAPAVGGRGSEKREAWACVGRAQMNNNI